MSSFPVRQCVALTVELYCHPEGFVIVEQLSVLVLLIKLYELGKYSDQQLNVLFPDRKQFLNLGNIHKLFPSSKALRIKSAIWLDDTTNVHRMTFSGRSDQSQA